MPSIYAVFALGAVPVVLLIVLAAIGALARKAKNEEYLKRRATRLTQPVPTVTNTITNVKYGLHE